MELKKYRHYPHGMEEVKNEFGGEYISVYELEEMIKAKKYNVRWTNNTMLGELIEKLVGRSDYGHS